MIKLNSQNFKIFSNLHSNLFIPAFISSTTQLNSVQLRAVQISKLMLVLVPNSVENNGDCSSHHLLNLAVC